jgi:hypothetical protein
VAKASCDWAGSSSREEKAASDRLVKKRFLLPDEAAWLVGVVGTDYVSLGVAGLTWTSNRVISSLN